ncbi:CAP domain-containing protein [Legionella dresdenensis]|uniref:CAP domain-containing protein n=1 Tax=Legionella dresdenensis TaxID=450200 RepID=A0ABV8CGX6_9GAMM
MKKAAILLLATLLPLPLFATNQTNNVSAEQVLYYINQYRSEHHLQPLKLDSRMSEQARLHSLDMATHKVPFGHDGFRNRIGIIYKQVNSPRGGAENVAYNYKTAQDVVYNWVRSPGHQRNIVGNYNLTGIGIVRDSQGKLYYTQLFVRAG